MALMPCCLPIKSSGAFLLNGIRIDPKLLHDMESPSAAWVGALLQGTAADMKDSRRAPLSSRSHAADPLDRGDKWEWSQEIGKTVITASKPPFVSLASRSMD